MNKNLIFYLSVFIFLFSCAESKTNKTMKNSFNQDEIIFVVEMDSNDNKSNNDIENFSKYYTDEVKKNEPNSLGWGFYKSGDKIILIERYVNGEAMMQHGKNISEGGVLETQFTKFTDHFTINKIAVYGNAADELKKFVEPFDLTFNFHPSYAKYSRK